MIKNFIIKVCWWQLCLSSERARKCNQILPKGSSGEPIRTLLSLSLPTSSPLLKVSPNFAYAYTLLGHEYVLVEELEKALACFRFAWQITSNWGETLHSVFLQNISSSWPAALQRLVWDRVDLLQTGALPVGRDLLQVQCDAPWDDCNCHLLQTGPSYITKFSCPYVPCSSRSGE